MRSWQCKCVVTVTQRKYNNKLKTPLFYKKILIEKYNSYGTLKMCLVILDLRIAFALNAVENNY